MTAVQYGRTDAFRTFDDAWADMQAALVALDGSVNWSQRPQVRRHGRWFSWDGFGNPISVREPSDGNDQGGAS